jgi:heptose-I-phosphate ethanolaminephosphotransferase
MNAMIDIIRRIFPVVRIYVALITFLALAFCVEFFVVGYEKFRFYNALENVILSIGLISLIQLISPQKKWSLLRSLTCFYIVLIVWLEGVYYLIFNAVFSPSAIFIAIDTNASESLEFLKDYFSYPVMIYSFLVLLTGFLLIRFEAVLKPAKPNRFLYGLGVLSAIFGLSHPMIYTQSLPYTFSVGVYEYWKTARELSLQQMNKTGIFTDALCELSGDELYVVVIGESTSRKHLQLYGYERETNPKLLSIKDELKIYDEVVSEYSYTIASLTRALRLGDDIKSGNIIQLLNAAELDTYWLSNQAPIGLYETLVTKIGMTAQHSKFTSSETWFYNAPYDEVVLPHFKEIVEKKGAKTVFIHLLGTHGAYDMRYPSNFKRFDPALGLSRHPKVDHYDNAVLYNDYVVSQIIDITKSSGRKSFVLYFSDHGEEVYDEIDYAGHVVDQNITKNMFEIPFILWQSNSFKEQRKIQTNTDQKFSLANLSHAIADLCGVSSPKVDFSKSLFNGNFQPSPRIIMDSLDYDEMFLSNKQQDH